MRRASRVDENQSDIVSTLRQAGASVAITSAVGSGFPDLVVGIHGRNYLVEVKDGPAKREDLTDDQILFFLHWRGDTRVIATIDDALKLLKEAKQ